MDDLQPRIAALAEAIGNSTMPVIVVSNEVGGALTPTTRSGRIFQDALGVTNARIAARCTEVTMMVAGVPMEVRRAS
jgi:adenosylcobinamide kinase/adenosylcobinamide-phosphate guanylyltransferase